MRALLERLQRILAGQSSYFLVTWKVSSLTCIAEFSVIRAQASRSGSVAGSSLSKVIDSPDAIVEIARAQSIIGAGQRFPRLSTSFNFLLSLQLQNL